MDQEKNQMQIQTVQGEDLRALMQEGAQQTLMVQEKAQLIQMVVEEAERDPQIRLETERDLKDLMEEEIPQTQMGPGKARMEDGEKEGYWLIQTQEGKHQLIQTACMDFFQMGVFLKEQQLSLLSRLEALQRQT